MVYSYKMHLGNVASLTKYLVLLTLLKADGGDSGGGKRG